MQWYYAVGDQRQGPVEHAEFERLVSSGTIRSDTLVWRQGMTEWQAYSAVVGVAAGGAAVDDGTEVCAVSGKRYPRREMINYEGKWISAEHRDQYFQRMREGVAQPGEGPVPGPFGYGGFWRRFIARMLDGLIQGVVIVPVALIGVFMIASSNAMQAGNPGPLILFQVGSQVFFMALGLVYDIFFIRKYDATPGKMALGMQVLRADGSKLSVPRIIGRYFAHLLNGFTLMIGYIIAAFDSEKRALHDRICETRVIKTR
jgi:uncharacterized RDD family membrane protein YckC